MLPQNNPLLCPRCSKPIQRIAKYNEDGTQFLGNKLRCVCGLKAFEVSNERGWRKIHRLRTRRYLNVLEFAETFRNQLEVEFTRLTGEKVLFYINQPASLLRLLNLRALLLKHQISSRELCRVINKLRPLRGSGGILQRLGWPLSRLTGPALQREIEDELQKAYPRSSPAEVQVGDERYTQLVQLISASKTGSFPHRVRSLERARKILRRDASERNYRGNPWDD